jgi:hypothetical protein
MSKAQKPHAKVIECADIGEHVRSLKNGSRARKRARAIALFVGLVLTVSTFLSDWAQAQNNSASPTAVATPIGKVVTAKGTVSVEHVSAVVVQASTGGGEQTKVGDLVYKADVILTGAESAVGIVFSDGTAFNLSSNARMVLNEFVYDPKGTSNSTLFSLSKGTFTFIAGKVAKTGDMKIDTPVATMGIRGTTPHVEIREDGTVAFSTLVEDKKAIEKAAAPAEPTKKQRQAKNAVSPSMPSSSGLATSPVQQSKKLDSKPERKLDSSLDINVRICRGC